MNLLQQIVVAFALLSVAVPAQAGPPALRYKAPTENVQYSVKITVDTPAEKNTYQGRITYEGSVDGSDTLRLTYQGGLSKSSQKKSTSRPGRPFGDPFGGRSAPRPPMAPFGRFSGSTDPGALRQTTAKITMTPDGQILSLEGDSQIPLPLGHLSLLPFESLPDEPKSDWTVSNGVLLGKKAQPSNGFPGDPFARRGQPGKTSAGSETSRFRLSGTKGSLHMIDKDYELESPNTDPAFQLTGGGPLVFDQDQGLFVSANLNYQLAVQDGNVEVKLPVKVEFEVLTAEKLAAIEREANEAAEKAAEEAMAAARAQFAGKSEDEIAEIYRTGGKVPPTGRKITAEMRLPKGLIIQSKWPHHDNWAVVKVLQELPDGKVEVVSIETGSQGEKARSTLLLAPDFVEQPFVSEAELAAFRRQLAEQTTSVPNTTEFHIWRDASGKFSVEAKYLRMDGDNVILRRKDNNQELKVPRSRLSQSDQQFVSQQEERTTTSPFE